MVSTLQKRHVVGFFLFLLLSFKIQAQNYQLTGDYFVRSSTDFLSENNKIGVLQEGSTFRVVNRIQQRNEAEALEIEVTAMTSGSYVKPSPSGKIFIYRAKQSHIVSRSGTEAAANVIPCKDCDGTSSNKTAAASNQINIGEVAEGVVILANKAPKAKKETATVPIPVPFVGPQLPGSLDEKIKKYSNSKEVARMIDWAMKSKNTHSTGNCYRKVKEALATQCGPDKKRKDGTVYYHCNNPFKPEGGRLGPGNNLTSKVSTEMADQAALSAKNRLKKDGFVNLLEIEPYKSQIKSPSQAPKGTILVYSSGIPCDNNADCGHTEIKTDSEGKPGYVSDYYSADAINETARVRKYRNSNYKLVGVMIKP